MLVPALATSLLGFQIGPVGQSLARLLGCGLISLGMLTYRLRSVDDRQVVRAVLASLFTGTLIAALVTLVGQVFMLLDPALVNVIESTIGSMPKGGAPVWVLLVVLLGMTGGYAYLLSATKAPVRKTKASRSAA